jgi:hypothetical protein
MVARVSRVLAVASQGFFATTALKMLVTFANLAVHPAPAVKAAETFWFGLRAMSME